jgi:hypothetical protein
VVCTIEMGQCGLELQQKIQVENKVNTNKKLEVKKVEEINERE